MTFSRHTTQHSTAKHSAERVNVRESENRFIYNRCSRHYKSHGRALPVRETRRGERESKNNNKMTLVLHAHSQLSIANTI